MGVSIYWKPRGGFTALESNYTSRDKGALEEVFGSMPTTLTIEDIQRLRAMSALVGGENIYEELAETIESVGDIEISCEW